MAKEFEVRWEGELSAGPQEVWDAVTLHTEGWLWKIDYEPWLGGAERGLSSGGGTVTAWDPLRHFATRTRPEGERDGLNELEPRGAGTYLRYVHRGVLPEDYDRQRDSCRRHTAFYDHSLDEHATAAFPGVRSADALYRVYGRDAWGWPVSLAHHLFAEGADQALAQQAWSGWLNGVFATEAVA
jgi:hypothetical protein